MTAAGGVSVTSEDGTVLRCTDVGGGPPVVLLHGLACGPDMWNDVVGALRAAGRRCVIVELRGHGRSAAGEGGGADGFGLGELAGDVLAVLEGLDLSDAVVVGHSAGGYSVLAFAAWFPDVLARRVRRIVLVGTSTSVDRVRERLILRFSCSRLFYRMLSVPPLGRLVVQLGAFGRRPLRAAVEATRRTALACPRPTKVSWVRAVSGTSLSDVVREISVPLVMASGSRDTIVRSPVALTGAGHMAPVEVPDEVAALILGVRSV